MNSWWQYFLPLFGAGLIVGTVCGTIAFRRNKRWAPVIAGAAAAAALALLWHGPAGGAARLTAQVERRARLVLDDWEMPAVSARLQRAPLTRRLELSGAADSFQRGELAKLMSFVPGVSSATWVRQRTIPLFAEAIATSFLGFLLGLLLAYLVDLRRRHNAHWSW